MARSFDRDALLDAFDRIGAAAVDAGTRMEIAVYGGSALMLASNFRFATEDVDIAEIHDPWPDWLISAVEQVASQQGWAADWLNEAVTFHLSRLATFEEDHVEFGSFPRSDGPSGLIVHVPTADYMLALKVKAMRTLDPVKGEVESIDIRNLMRVAGAVTPEDAVAIMARYFPRSAVDAGKQVFLLRRVLAQHGAADAPAYPLRVL